MRVEVGPNDILCGRGKKVAGYNGNVQFRSFIDKYVKEYHEAKSNAAKKNVSLKVCAEVANLNPPGRFLYMDRGQYIVQTDAAEVDKKIKCAFRDRIKRENKKNIFTSWRKVDNSKPTGNEKEDFCGTVNDHGMSNLPPPNASSNSNKSFESFISALSLITISASNLYPSSAKIIPTSLDDLFVSDMSISMSGGLNNNLSGNMMNVENETKMFPRHRDMLEKREYDILEKRESEKGNIAMHAWPTSIDIEDDSPLMLPDDLDCSSTKEMFVGTNMTSV